MAKILDPGSYSTGTLRDVDIAEMFVGMFEPFDAAFPNLPVECQECRDLGTDAATLHAALAASGASYAPECGLLDSDVVAETLAECFDHAGEHCPEGYYFGATEGDGADFGVWRVEGDDDDADDAGNR